MDGDCYLSTHTIWEYYIAYSKIKHLRCYW